MSNLPSSCQWPGTLSTHCHGRNQQALTWSIFKLLIQACFPWLRRSGCSPRLFGSKASLRGEITQLVFTSALLVLKSLTLNFLHQLEAMSPARTGCHISKILNDCACSCPFFPYFSLLFLALNSKKNLRESLWRRKFCYSWGVIGFSSCFYIIMVLKKGTTHTVLKLPLHQYNFVSRVVKGSSG